MATDRFRFTISVTSNIFEAIEDFRFKNRYQTRSEATSELIRLGLEYSKTSNQFHKFENNDAND